MLAIKGNKDSVEMLIKARADMNIQNMEGHTALMRASDEDRRDITEVLIKAGAKLDIQAHKNGDTALILASHRGYSKIVKMLIKAGANPDIKDSDGNTALMHASSNGHESVVEILVNSNINIDINIQNKNGMTALMIASTKENKDILKILIRAGAKLDIHEGKGITALMLALHNDTTDIAKILILAGADVNIKNSYGTSALMYYIQKSDLDMVKFILQNSRVTIIDEAVVFLHSQKLNKTIEKILDMLLTYQQPSLSPPNQPWYEKCNNPIEMFSQDEISNMAEFEVVKIVFDDYGKIECFNKESLKNWFNSLHYDPMVIYVKNPNSTHEVDEQGYGSIPMKNSAYFYKNPGEHGGYFTENVVNQIMRDNDIVHVNAVPRLIPLGNHRGVFTEISTLHGQLPGQTIFKLVNK